MKIYLLLLGLVSFVKAIDYYQVLGVSPDADEAEIKKSFRT